MTLEQTILIVDAKHKLRSRSLEDSIRLVHMARSDLNPTRIREALKRLRAEGKLR